MDIYWLNDDRMHPACGGLFVRKLNRTPLFQPLQKEGPEHQLQRLEMEESCLQARLQKSINDLTTATPNITENYQLPPYDILATVNPQPQVSRNTSIAKAREQAPLMRQLLESAQFCSKKWSLPLLLGRDELGNPLILDLGDLPHLIVAGNSGPTLPACMNSIIISIMMLRKPHEVKLILIDPCHFKMAEFKDIPHLLTPVVTGARAGTKVLLWAVRKMKARQQQLRNVGARSIATFNRISRDNRLANLPKEVAHKDYIDPMPHIVIIVDDFEKMMTFADKEIERAIVRLAKKARAVGIHLILSTQLPSIDVLTGLIKMNLPCRICSQVKSTLDSRIVLDHAGAESLAGNEILCDGAGNSNLVRAKIVSIAEEEVRKVVQFCKNQTNPEYSDEVID